MIAGDDWRPEEIKPLLASLEPHCQALYVNWNGTKRKPRWGNWTSMSVHYLTSSWNDDFAQARNAAYKMIPKKDYGWWLWIDSDDLLVAPEGFAPLFDDIDPYTRGFVLRYAYAVEPDSGKVVVEHWRERLLSLDWVWAWKWPIHETCSAPQGTQVVRGDGEKVFIQHQRTSGDDRGARDRNRRIIARAAKEFPGEPRFAYYFANETYREADLEAPGVRKGMLCDAGIVAYRRFLSLKPEGDDAYGAAVRMGDLFFMKEDYNGAVDAYLQAAKFYPNWAEAWLGCARSMLREQDFRRMRDFADIASRLERPLTQAAVQPLDYSFNPLFLRAIANEEMGELSAALVDYTAARKIYNDPDNRLDTRISMLRKRLRSKQVVADPKADRRKTRGTKPDKSICFFTNPVMETWNQKTLHEAGHGGAETLVLEMAKRFAADGWRTAVFGCPGDQEGLGDDGVEYWKSEDWLPLEPFTVFVSSRAMTPFAGPISSDYKFLWMHDVNLGPNLRAIAGNPTMIVPISNWHKLHLQQLYGFPDDRLHVIPNGIDLAQYPEQEGKDGHRFVWSSSPDRGLDYLVAMWPMIRELWPDATLDVFYGWSFIDKILDVQPHHPLGLLKYKIMNQWDNNGGEEIGMYWYDRVSPAELAKKQLEADVWAYPTGFMETFCLTAVQAQAAGCLPATSDLAALKETVACDWLRVGGWPGNSDYQTRYLEMLQVVLDDTPEAADLRAHSRRLGRKLSERYTLDASYAAWHDLFKSCGLRGA